MAKQQGSMLVLALFVIVVLAMLGLAVSKLLSASTDSVVFEVLGQRALNAARSGVEVSIAAAFPLNSLNSVNSRVCGQLSSPDFSAVAGLQNCKYSAQCSKKDVQDNSITKTYYQFRSTGQCSSGKVVVSRTVYVDAMQ